MADKKDKRTFVMCDSSKVNSYGFRIDLAGMDLERFSANPVMLYRHNSDELIGRWENVRVEDGKLMGEPVFDLEDETAKMVSGKVERGFLKGSSVGIMINEMKETDKESVATKTELIEASLVSIPADAGAVILYDSNRRQLSFDDFRTLQTTFLTNSINMEEPKNPVTPDKKDEEIAQLKAELAKNKKSAILAMLMSALAQGKISEAEKPHFERLAESDFDTVKAIIDARPEKQQGMSLKDLQHNAAVLTPGRENWTYLEWMKKDPQGLKAMRLNNPTAFEQLQQTLK